MANGLVPPDSEHGVMFGAAGYVSYRYKTHLITARSATSAEIWGNNIWDFGLLYGRTLLDSDRFVSVSAGASYVEGVRSEGFFGRNSPIPATLGLAVEAQIFLRPLSFLGVGFYLFGSLNNEENFFGAAASLQLGKMRN